MTQPITNSVEDTLESCPFCNTAWPRLFEATTNHDGQPEHAVIDCSNLNCGCSYTAKTTEECIDGWNNRS